MLAEDAAAALYPTIGHIERAAGFTRDDSTQTKLDKLDAVLDETGLLSMWNAQREGQSPIRQFMGHSDKITSIAVGTDRRVLISGSWDETAKVWDLEDGTDRATFAGHDDALLCVAISPDGRLVASAGWDDTIWIWDRT